MARLVNCCHHGKPCDRGRPAPTQLTLGRGLDELTNRVRMAASELTAKSPCSGRHQVRGGRTGRGPVGLRHHPDGYAEKGPDGFRFYDLRHTGHTLVTPSGATLKDARVRAGQSCRRRR